MGKTNEANLNLTYLDPEGVKVLSEKFMAKVKASTEEMAKHSGNKTTHITADERNKWDNTSAKLSERHKLLYAACNTASAERIKEITIIDKQSIENGDLIAIAFENSNSFNSSTTNDFVQFKISGELYSINTHVNSTGTFVKATGTNVFAFGSARVTTVYRIDTVNKALITVSHNLDWDTKYTPQTLGFGIGSCTTPATTNAKVVTLNGYGLSINGTVTVAFTNAVPASATLNINNKGAKPIWYRGSTITGDIIEAGDRASFIYDGSRYHLLSVDKLSSIKGIESFVSADNVNPTALTAMPGALTTGEKHSSLLNKLSIGMANLRYLIKLIGSTNISSIGNGTVTGAISALNTKMANLKGEKGDRGEKGEKGDAFTYSDFTQSQLNALKGPKGDKGAKGDPFLYKDFTASQLNDLKGEKGDKGDAFKYSDFTSEQLAALKGPKGDPGKNGSNGLKGDKGDKGDRGEKGDTGKAFTYSDFTAEQLADLKGPKGDKGDKGDPGQSIKYSDLTAAEKAELKGPKGDKGDKGEVTLNEDNKKEIMAELKAYIQKEILM